MKRTNGSVCFKRFFPYIVKQTRFIHPHDLHWCLLNKVSTYASVNSKCALPPPPGNCGAFARLVSPGGGAFASLARPGGRAFANPGDNPEKFVDVFKGMFS